MPRAPGQPAFLVLHSRGELRRRAARAAERLQRCNLCPHDCGVDRTAGEPGTCGIGERALVASWGPHHGEERPLSGTTGSGAVFFSGCNLACVFCQNSEISHGRIGREVDGEELAAIFLRLQEAGCHNINLVSPSHVIAQVLDALVLAADHGLRLPIVYNTGGYDSLATLLLLDGVVDVFMPDMKYGVESPEDRPGASGIVGSRHPDPLTLSGAANYVEINRDAVREMHRQVGDLVLDENGIALRGLLVRHLVMPGGTEHTESVLRFLSSEISPSTFLNLMDQYRPCYRAREYPPLDRRPTDEEFLAAEEIARRFGLL